MLKNTTTTVTPIGYTDGWRGIDAANLKYAQAAAR
jgi:hypothetical protein